ncbi:phenylacetate--CoA ligase family protein [Clostridium formicaceticum]|uniref:CoF synthetase n=1 Tax=Clostridium formicaceticum TaxID=1497 RepID=A0AAC9WFY7_9CLOT|nr:phenylacetate--CoA ligase [Clostridium formicaceticum]AOY75921.1 CoF synthetase [Clostridium formicaceticum]ARE86265.1 Phenylacetate-coenzyme A ligase [Clostridium formicaceticum]
MGYRQFWNKEIETLSREELEAYQVDQLSQHLLLAYNQSAYYKEAFDQAGVKPSDFKELSDIRKFPFTNKQIERERQGLKPFLGDMTAVEEEEVVFVSASSGSTGVPTLSPFTRQDFEEFQDVQSRLFWAAGMRPTDRYVHALNFTLFVGGPDVIGAQNLGALCLWAGAIPSDRLLFILKEFQPTMIWTTPSYAWYLGETARKQGIDPAKDLAIKRIIVAGEAGGSIDATRTAIEELWGAEVYDFYGISDIFGACAGACEARDGLHIAEDHILVEVLNPETLEPVEEGERGELVLTTLRKTARPMIRFRTGDIVTYTKEPCTCGRTHGRVNITGRLDDMFIVSGVNVFPSDVEFVIRNIPELTGEYRITVFTENFTTKYKVEVEKLATSDIDEAALIAKVQDSIKTRLGVRPKEVVLLKEGELPRATHKAKRLIDLRNN